MTHKEHLPVKQLRFGDTGSPLDEKEGRYTLGPLMCEGDGMLYRILKVHVVSRSCPQESESQKMSPITVIASQ